MEFWGHEIRPRTSVSFEVDDGYIIHLSQVALGESKKGPENVVVFVKVGDKKLAIGTLSADKHPHISCDLIFRETFELSHNSKTTSVFLTGYKTKMPDMFESDSVKDEDEEMETDEIPVKNNENEKSAAKVPAKGGKNEKQDGDNENDDSETSSGTDESDDSKTSSGTDESDDSETFSGTDESDDSESSSGTDECDDSETSSGTDGRLSSEDDSSDEYGMSSESDYSEDEETSLKPEVGKKRAVATALKTPASDKKAKISTPASDKTSGDKKSVHVDTPHPATKASKTPADGKWKEKAPKDYSLEQGKGEVPQVREPFLQVMQQDFQQ